jgi:hypothetical protein
MSSNNEGSNTLSVIRSLLGGADVNMIGNPLLNALILNAELQEPLSPNITTKAKKFDAWLNRKLQIVNDDEDVDDEQPVDLTTTTNAGTPTEERTSTDSAFTIPQRLIHTHIQRSASNAEYMRKSSMDDDDSLVCYN